MSRWTSILLATLIALTWVGRTNSVHAQASGLALASLQIDIWPEYDKPSVLVLLSGTLQPGTKLPADVTVRIPAASGRPSAVAINSLTNQLVNAPYTPTVSGDQILVTFHTDSLDFRVEYYDSAMTVTGQARDFVLRWTSDYPVNSATLRVQEPVGAAHLAGEPPVTLAGTGDLGLNYYTAALGALNAGQTVNFHLTYSRTTTALSTALLAQSTPQVAVAAPAQSAPAGTTASVNWYFVAAGILAGLLVLGAGGYWYFKLRPAAEDDVRPSRRRARSPAREARSATAAEKDSTEPAGFCTRCGRPLQEGDLFCRRCGTPVRR
jgi:hypothetical protein